jgi:phosphate-selective porin
MINVLKSIKECIKDKFNNFDEFKKKYKNKKDIEKLRIELINIETKHIEDFKLINY